MQSVWANRDAMAGGILDRALMEHEHGQTVTDTRQRAGHGDSKPWAIK